MHPPIHPPVDVCLNNKKKKKKKKKRRCCWWLLASYSFAYFLIIDTAGAVVHHVVSSKTMGTPLFSRIISDPCAKSPPFLSFCFLLRDQQERRRRRRRKRKMSSSSLLDAPCVRACGWGGLCGVGRSDRWVDGCSSGTSLGAFLAHRPTSSPSPRRG